jgi:1,4-dihydroxy-2-naphthoyl-CoA synthase
LLSAEGPSSKDGVYLLQGLEARKQLSWYVGEDGQQLKYIKVQRLIRFIPKVVIAVVPGWL